MFHLRTKPLCPTVGLVISFDTRSSDNQFAYDKHAYFVENIHFRNRIDDVGPENVDFLIEGFQSKHSKLRIRLRQKADQPGGRCETDHVFTSPDLSKIADGCVLSALGFSSCPDDSATARTRRVFRSCAIPENRRAVKKTDLRSQDNQSRRWKTELIKNEKRWNAMSRKEMGWQALGARHTSTSELTRTGPYVVTCDDGQLSRPTAHGPTDVVFPLRSQAQTSDASIYSCLHLPKVMRDNTRTQ
jgi:hypothetical protein